LRLRVIARRARARGASPTKPPRWGRKATMSKHNVAGLEDRVQKLSKNLSSLRVQEDLKELLLVIRRPGWTTPAELIFATEIVDSMLAQTATLAALSQGLLASSREVGQQR
jgi:hypothetical protein